MHELSLQRGVPWYEPFQALHCINDQNHATVNTSVRSRYAALDAHPWVLALVNLSEPAMDTFLILTGFLAANSLGPAFQSGKRPSQVGPVNP